MGSLTEELAKFQDSSILKAEKNWGKFLGQANSLLL